jgi:ABC-type multidrug transport system ATPase subunit
MTAVMGGSGSGKSSLLNALCGRAFYGKTTGKVFINGNESKIENHKSSIGFVPQEDIVYADLTVRENLVCAISFVQ